VNKNVGVYKFCAHNTFISEIKVQNGTFKGSTSLFHICNTFGNRKSDFYQGNTLGLHADTRNLEGVN